MAVQATGAVRAWQEDVKLNNVTVVYSVPHTGTHFCMHFLEDIGRESMQFHSQEVNIVQAYQAQGGNCVVPFRHPYKVFVSHFQRNDAMRHLGWEAVMTKLVSNYSFMIQTIGLFDYVTVQLDCEESDRLPQLIRVAQHVGAEEFRLEQKNGTIQAANDTTKTVLKWADEWPVVGWRKYQWPIPAEVEWERLDAVLDWCGYKPIDMTNYMHQEGDSTFKVEQHSGGGIDLVVPKVQAKGTAIVRRKDGTETELSLSSD